MPRYPFSPEILDSLPEELAELFRGLELTLLKQICERLNLADQLNEVTVDAMRALRSHGISQKDIEKAIRDVTGISQKKLDKLLDDVVERNQAYYTEMIDLAHVTAPAALVNADDIEAIRKQAQREFRNITASMGFLVDSGRTMLKPAECYQWALDSAVLDVQSGAISYNEAIRSAIRQLADSGLKTVDYESGHVDQIDVAVRRAVMSGVNALNQKYRDQSAEYLETDKYEVTAHLGARNIPGPKGWEAHSEWQGGVYTAEELVTVCGKGDVQGIGGANCRHSYWPFVDGVMERTYTDTELEAMKPENRPKITFDGVEYDDYQAQQMQRKLERTIRKQKRRKAAFEAAGQTEDATAAGARLRALNAKYTAFSKAAGLPRQIERMRVEYP